MSDFELPNSSNIATRAAFPVDHEVNFSVPNESSFSHFEPPNSLNIATRAGVLSSSSSHRLEQVLYEPWIAMALGWNGHVEWSP